MKRRKFNNIAKAVFSTSVARLSECSIYPVLSQREQKHIAPWVSITLLWEYIECR